MDGPENGPEAKGHVEETVFDMIEWMLFRDAFLDSDSKVMINFMMVTRSPSYIACGNFITNLRLVIHSL
jgi:hypothetical protein